MIVTAFLAVSACKGEHRAALDDTNSDWSPTEAMCSQLHDAKRPTKDMSNAELWKSFRYFEMCTEEPDTANTALHELARRGDKDAMFTLAITEQYGVNGNEAKAREWMERAAAAGHVQAAKELGSLNKKDSE
jgi:TPR repeat protein